MLILWAVKQWTFPLFYRRLAYDDSRPGLRKPVRRPRPPIHTRRSFSPEEWSVLSDTARCEGVAPLLHYTLETAGRGEEVPGDVRQSLYQEYLNAGAANVRLYHELSRIVKALQPTGDLPIVVLKGAALATTIYPNIALRPFGDLDLLLPEKKVPEAVRSLKALGYDEPFPDVAQGLNALVGHHVHLLRTHRGASTTVEVHWSLIGGRHDRRTPSLDWFWKQSEPFACPDVPVPFPRSFLTLNPTAHLLYLCAHLMLQHGEGDPFLRWFYDIHLLIEREGERSHWDELVGRVREFEWTTTVSSALQTTQRSFQTRIPRGFLRSLSADGFDKSSRGVARQAETGRVGAARVLDAASLLSPAARLRFLLGSAFPSPAYLRWRYRPRPPWLWPLFYVYRWFIFVRDAIVTLGGRASLRRPDKG